MHIKEIKFTNIKCFPELDLKLSEKINIITGKNNCGKSTILKTVDELLHSSGRATNSLRAGSTGCKVAVIVDSDITYYSDYRLNGNATVQCINSKREIIEWNPWSRSWPNNNMISIFSSRANTKVAEEVNAKTINEITGSFTTLASRMDYVLNPTSGRADQFIELCRQLFGRPITLAYSGKGKIPAIELSPGICIKIDDLGAGVPNALKIAVEVLLAENIVFVIEELETDLHPSAVRVLCDLILASSEKNQFIISTHSNVVLSALGMRDGTKVFQVLQDQDYESLVPTSTVAEVKNDETNQFTKLLSHLGYDLIDAGLYTGWLFFEESSAEQIVREFLIPWFVPELNGNVRTYSTAGATNAKNRFATFNGLFVFSNLSQLYKNRAFVFLDAGLEETKVIDDLKKMWCAPPHDWDPSSFVQFGSHDFEDYYPEEFKVIGQSALRESDASKRRSLKAKCLQDLVAATKDNEAKFKALWMDSAAPIIAELKKVSSALGY